MAKALRSAAALAAVAATLASQAYSSDDETPAQRAVEYRTSFMEILSWNARPMGRMLKGEETFEADAFLRHARDLANATRLDLLSGFPEGSTTDDSAAKDEIWFTWDDFAQKFADLQTAGEALGSAAAGGDMEATKSAFARVGDACKACHKAYKE